MIIWAHMFFLVYGICGLGLIYDLCEMQWGYGWKGASDINHGFYWYDEALCKDSMAPLVRCWGGNFFFLIHLLCDYVSLFLVFVFWINDSVESIIVHIIHQRPKIREQKASTNGLGWLLAFEGPTIMSRFRTLGTIEIPFFSSGWLSLWRLEWWTLI